jgi:ER-bound oxygenase mpaB/B'/Rubber oxygenase, catalytic domain
MRMESIFDIGRLPPLRGQGDPVADAVVADAVDGASYQDAGHILADLLGNLRSLRSDARVTEWIQEIQPTPPWVDSALVAKGQELFTEWSLDIVTALFCASLPFAYAADQGVEVLERTSQLADPGTIARRIAETGAMLLDVSEPGSLAPGRRGYQTVRIVRLLHAVIRARLTLIAPTADGDPPVPAWDNQTLGVPINQEDLLGTLLSFTTVVFRAFANMGMPLDAHDQESYLQLWGAIGALLGLESAEYVLVPSDAEALTDVIAEELHRRSPAGRHLMDVLMGEMEISMPWGLRKLPRTLVRHLAGDQLADMLSVEPAAWWGGLLPALAAINRRTAKFPPGRAILQAPSRLLGRSMIRMWIDRSILGEGSTRLRIDPPKLARLGIRTGPDRTDVGLRGRLRGHRRKVRQRRRHAGGADRT